MPENKHRKKLRGVNLGGWLVLEKWMTPSLFEGLEALDETAYCVELGERAGPLLKQHWNSFITRDDFAWLAKTGINAVRIPVGHWLFGSDYPYHAAYGSLRYPFVQGGIDILDQAMRWAEEFGLCVVLDLHAAPGCQNGFDNGGIQGVCEWHTQPAFIDYSLTVLERLADRYATSTALHAIQVLNEPRWDIATEVLKQYNQDAYHRIRKYCQPEHVAIVVHDGFRSYKEYQDFMNEPEYQNVVFDIHRYQCFVQDDIDLDIYGHIQKAAIDWKNEADDIISGLALPTYVGEWSLGLDKKVFSLWEEGAFNHALSAMDAVQMTIAYRAFAAAELVTFEKYLGWFFWSYKTETTPEWCFRACVERDWLPDKFA
ncbi:glycoside hydrolase family 5 protein [Methylicorpusculum sp.]|uniref:glycoside hydrolase family 5 protein n=1 Tax=Methylicorpusculum sp. TaxID=2713644 RepID=UPI00272F30FB|nr:glycoside hydrolase family 5 protein [Methylicorpusculum sp.]MDP2179915.1 glycoside hydrolase family 5 protein [Methylicorpusculum sp.]MDP3529184.1 glycoside hydrolase family 5 protein [Methylicorpusculum sp.]MDZ4150879.1 glycoside hydrolase family 5 protein [Methylicorpusculum sp.]